MFPVTKVMFNSIYKEDFDVFIAFRRWVSTVILEATVFIQGVNLVFFSLMPARFHILGQVDSI